MFVLRASTKDAAISSESKMDANKKREITFGLKMTVIVNSFIKRRL